MNNNNDTLRDIYLILSKSIDGISSKIDKIKESISQFRSDQATINEKIRHLENDLNGQIKKASILDDTMKDMDIKVIDKVTDIFAITRDQLQESIKAFNDLQQSLNKQYDDLSTNVNLLHEKYKQLTDKEKQYKYINRISYIIHTAIGGAIILILSFVKAPNLILKLFN